MVEAGLGKPGEAADVAHESGRSPSIAASQQLRSGGMVRFSQQLIAHRRWAVRTVLGSGALLEPPYPDLVNVKIAAQAADAPAASEALFQQLLGERFAMLPDCVQRLHRRRLTAQFAGVVSIRPASGRWARMLAGVLGLPTRASSGPIRVEIEATSNGQRWTRHFPGRRMVSTMRCKRGRLYERLGPVTLGFDLIGDPSGIRWRLIRVWLLGVPLPTLFTQHTEAFESAEAGGRYRFEASAGLPLIGHLVEYAGTLDVD